MTKTKTKAKTKRPSKATRPSLLDDVRALPNKRSSRFEFTPEQVEEIRELRVEIDARRVYVSASALARLLKSRDAMPWSLHSIRMKLAELAGGKW